MIEHLNVVKHQYIATPKFQNSPSDKHHPKFGNAANLLTLGLQACEQHPMIGVSVIDATTCILPRAGVDFRTNPFAGLETLRRESSGLLVNCLLPSFFVYGIAKLLENSTLDPKYRHLNMAGSWANEDSMRKLAGYFKSAEAEKEGTKGFVKRVIGDLSAHTTEDGVNKWVSYKSNEATFNKVADLLTDAIENKTGKKELETAINSAHKLLVESTKAEKTIRFAEETAYGADLHTVIRDLVDMGKKFSDKAVKGNIDEFLNSAVKFVNHKSLVGMAVVIPLAASMQSINRWITRKRSGVEGAPIYRDFGTDENKFGKKDNKLWMFKTVGASSIIGLALLSMMKKPNMKMFQFKGWFPTMDQARWIAAVTFASRILAAEDRNEVRESTFRDAAGFASLYFLGDYVAKGVASLMHKIDPKCELLNRHKEVKPDDGWMKRFGNWVKNCDLKSFDEVNPALKNRRSACQAISLGASMLILGLFIPLWNRKTTEKNVEIAKNKTANTPAPSPLASGPESTMSLLWHKVIPSSNTFRGFEKMSNFK